MILKMGDSGPAVRDIQLELQGLGFPLKGTGYFGNATDTAVRAFQKQQGLEPDGKVGPITLEKLKFGPIPESASALAETARPLWLQAGLATLGTKETPGSRDNPTIINWAKEEGGAIAKAYTHDSIPWCALWANLILSRAGLPGTETLWALDFAGKWPAHQIAGPAVGAFAPMVRNGGGHIMVVVGADQHGNVMGLGGNQSDAVTIAPFARSRLNKGFWWPNGVAEPTAVGFNKLPIVTSSGKVSKNEQ